MKRHYVRPVFIAEAYNFTESIASCYEDPNSDTAPVYVEFGDHLCLSNCDKGHNAGDKGNLYNKKEQFPITIFNDVAGNKHTGPFYNDSDKEHKYPYYIGCDYDWAGEEEAEKFSQDFFGNGSANSPQHRPSYKGFPLQS